ncbi:unnamed protein product [Acanthoscelides obtectus]|uniref:Uncharacterized protein n=1 Tax=Acanthoscelides obtectus TaxID=200917 RepID=A0A9P0MCZ6_ACAOB|nr:unnamed protein product [Acanthoscelides obtectus]CAK1627022.1 PiggyBac transposable element-derived protein 4 [Acanthoscelides obtectus]
MEKYHQTEFSPRTGRPSTQLTPLRLTGRHFPDLIPATEKKANPTRQCGICSRARDEREKKIRRGTKYYCADCETPLIEIHNLALAVKTHRIDPHSGYFKESLHPARVISHCIRYIITII